MSAPPVISRPASSAARSPLWNRQTARPTDAVPHCLGDTAEQRLGVTRLRPVAYETGISRSPASRRRRKRDRYNRRNFSSGPSSTKLRPTCPYRVSTTDPGFRPTCLPAQHIGIRAYLGLPVHPVTVPPLCAILALSPEPRSSPSSRQELAVPNTVSCAPASLFIEASSPR